MQLTGTFTWRDSFRIFLLAARPRLVWGIVGLMLVALAAFFLVTSWRDYLASVKDAPSPFALTFAVLFLLFLFGVYYPWIHFKAFRRSKLLSLPVTFILTDEALAFSNQYASGKYPWDLIVAARENRHLLLLYDAVGPFVPIPKRFLATNEMKARLYDLLRSKGLVG
jgi:hypothetical protein